MILFLCSLCGTPVEVPTAHAALLPAWGQELRQPVVVHCLRCAVPLLERC